MTAPDYIPSDEARTGVCKQSRMAYDLGLASGCRGTHFKLRPGCFGSVPDLTCRCHGCPDCRPELFEPNKPPTKGSYGP
jgi:hypothetical protein